MARLNLSFLALAWVSAAGLLAGCQSVNTFLEETEEPVGHYRVYDVETDASPVEVVCVLQKTVALGGKANFSYARLNAKPATQPGHFKPMGAINKNQDPSQKDFSGFQSIACPGAVWTANLRRHDQAHFQACLYRYRGGYRVNVFARYTQKRGKMTDVATTVMDYAGKDSDEAWAKSLFDAMARALVVQKAAKIEVLEALPPVTDAPWLEAPAMLTE